ncbi:MAG: nucleotidyltransferase family protein [Terracidiphilus sp.]
MTLPAIILAAGGSRRLGQPKQLLSFEGESLLERSLRLAREAGAAPVLAVLGANFASICGAVGFENAIPVLNDQWENGIASSIHAGLNEAEVRAPEHAGVLVMTCDQPRLTAEHLVNLLKAFQEHGAVSIIASEYASTKGIPAVFPRSVFHALRALQGDKGARSLFTKATCPVLALPFEGGEIDIDLPTDLVELD